MRIIRADTDAPGLSGGTVVCLGFFDGVHLGHAALLTKTVARAREKGLIACAHTFDRPPAAVLSGGAQRELTSLSEKAALMEALGVEVLAVSAFTDELARMPGRRFFEDILLARLSARHIVAGFHHRFGSMGDTDADALRALCREHGIGCDIIPPVRLPSGELISSTAIRAALGAGDIEKAETMLGRSARGLRMTDA